jgi:hypothetical protein
VYGEGQNSADFGDQRNPSPDEDAGFNLRQAYVNAGDLKKFPLLLKVGRQELSYGDERLIGAFDWNNIGRVFDAVKLRYEQSDLWVDGFTSHLVIPTESEWNEPNRDEFFSGVYASTRSLVPKVETQAYFLAQNANADSPSLKGDAGVNGDSPRDVYTVGFRVKSLPGQWSGWDYQAEFAGQFGNFEYLPNTPTVVNGTRLNEGAYAGYVAGGYTFEKTWATPRIGLEFNYASGDTDPTDNRHGTFVNLYPTNHRFYGYMDFVSWQNIINPRLQVSAQPLKALRLSVDYNLFWLAQTEDFFYQVNQAPRTTGGYGIRPGNDSFAGQEIDVVARYTISPAALLEAGYGHFFVGPYVKESLANTGGAVDANWFYMQFTLNF